jgi:DNA-binding transcriptional LysR family regulator
MLRNTVEGIEALAALAQFGTVSAAAAALRLTQSAVSKRLQRLQRSFKFQLLQHDGRRVQLTPEAHELLQRATSVLADVRALSAPSASLQISTFSLAMADSIAASWGPAVLAAALQRVKTVQLEVHVHRSVLLIENVRLGRYHIGLASDTSSSKDLVQYPLISEPMVLISGTRTGKGTVDRPLITAEPTSVTWRAIEPLLRAHHPELLARRRLPVETLIAAVQMVKSGFGDGVVPLGLAREMNVSPKSIRVLKHVERRVTLLARKNVNSSDSFTRLRHAIEAAARQHLGGS